ncbi:MAG: CDP-alcohol phosphatidyltransferase family protein [Desulfofustis sp.]|jgi:CDP-diacylglycerol--glycerol-3-phosphate 3-phosphatidyltransferase
MMLLSESDNGNGCVLSGESLARRTLHNQARWAALFIILPWLVFTCSFLYFGQFTSTTGLALLPGVGVAIYLTMTLWRNLETNRSTYDPALFYPTLGAANWLTLARGSGVVALACLLPVVKSQSSAIIYHASVTASVVYLMVALADLGDGLIARKSGRETELGKILDIETDAAGLMVAALVAVAFDRVPAFYLVVGMVYYFFIAGLYIRRRWNLPLVELQPRPYARITAGFQMGFLVVALVPVFSPLFCAIAALLFMLPLLLGFGRDWLVISGRLASNNRQHTRLDELAATCLRLFLAPALRLLIITAWVYHLSVSWTEWPSNFWLLTVSGCCILAAAGLLGRCASLTLILLLGSVFSPYEPTAAILMIFCGAIILLLGGTGSWSVWAPEEDILYRRHTDALAPE